MQWITKLGLATVAGLLLFLSGSCTKKNDDGDLQVLNSRLRDAVKTMDPATAYDTVSTEVLYMIMEPLYEYHNFKETYEVKPLLAADMPKVSADKLTITIPLRQDVKFADDPCFKATGGKGRLVTAQDFVFAFKRLADIGIESQGSWIFDGRLVGFTEFGDKLKAVSGNAERKKFLVEQSISGLKTPDDHTLELHLTKPYPSVLYALAMTFTAPIAKEAFDAYGDEKGNLTDHPVGTGPFTLKNWERERIIELVRNPNYHTDFYPTDGDQVFKDKGMLADAGKPLPFLDKINFAIMKEAQPAWLKFLKKETDIVRVDKDNFNQVIENRTQLKKEFLDRKIKLEIDPGNAFFYVEFNMKDKVVGGPGAKLLRQAIASSIDRVKWIDTFKNGAGVKMINGMPPGLKDRPTNKEMRWDLNIAKGKELLKKAGFPDGKGLPPLKLDMRGAASLDRQIGEFLTQQIGQLGIKIDVIYNTFPAYLTKVRKSNIQIALGGWSMDYPDAENTYQLLYSKNVSPGPNEANYENPEYDKLYEQLVVTEPGPKRAEIIQKLDDIIQEDVPWALGYIDSTYKVAQPWVMNYRYTDIIQNYYKYVRIDKELKKKMNP